MNEAQLTPYLLLIPIIGYLREPRTELSTRSPHPHFMLIQIPGVDGSHIST